MSNEFSYKWSDDLDDRLSPEELFSSLYAELHRMAHRELTRNGARFSISTTALLHEAYLSVTKQKDIRFADSRSLLAYAGRAMRNLIVDAARRRRALKRGGEFVITQLDTIHEQDVPDAQELGRIDEALQALELIDPQLAELVDLRYFCGLSFAEIGALQELSARTVQRHWEKARLLLFSLLSKDPFA
jgi:RNA polymerase sigma factor (TIGR02999 family)